MIQVEILGKEIENASKAFNMAYNKPYYVPSEVWEASNTLVTVRKRVARLLRRKLQAEQVDRLIIYYEELGRCEAAKEQNTTNKSI